MGSPMRTVNVMSDRMREVKPGTHSTAAPKVRRTAKLMAFRHWVNVMFDQNVGPDGTVTFTPRSWYDLYMADMLAAQKPVAGYNTFTLNCQDHFEVINKEREGCSVRMGNGVTLATTTLRLTVRRKPNSFFGD